MSSESAERGSGIRFLTFDNFITIKASLQNKQSKSAFKLLDSSTQEVKGLISGENISIVDNGTF